MAFVPGFDVRAEPTPRSRFVCVVDGKVLQHNGQWLHSYHAVSAISSSASEHRHIGYFGTDPYFMVGLPAPQLAGEFEFISLRALLGFANQDDFAIAARALQLSHWLNHNRFCGRCGHPTAPHRQESCLHCERCEAQYFPQIAPCVMGLVWRESQILLAHNTRFKAGKYSVLAGFIEAGENVEQALAREVKEEVGVDIYPPSYMASQPWPFPSQLMLGFFAQYRGGEITVDEVEIDHADWFDIHSLPDIPPQETLSGYLIREFVRSRQGLEVNNVL